EEFAEYTTFGKVSKTNSGDGAIKFYVYDANGNQTRELRGNGDPKATDLRTMSLETASSSNQVYYRISVYNSRNLLIKTIDPRMDYLASLDTLKSLYQQQWVPAWAPANPLIDSAD